MHGLNRYNRETKKFTPYYNNPANTNSISGNMITSLCHDKEGNLWIGTKNNGLNIWDYNAEKFIRYAQKEHNQSNPGDSSINCIFEDSNGAVWIGTNNGLSCLRKQKSIIKQYCNGGSTNYLSSNQVVSIIEKEKDILYVATKDDGINVFYAKEGRLINRNNSNTGITTLIKRTLTLFLRIRITIYG